MKTLSLRWRVTLWSALITGIAVFIFGAVVARVLWDEQIEVIDTQLATDARFAFAFRAERGDRELDNAGWVSLLPAADVSLRGFAFGPANSPQASGAHPQTLAPIFTERPSGRRSFTRLAGDRRLRIGVFTEQGTTLLLAASLYPAEESVGDLMGPYAIALPAVLLIAAGGSWWIARRALDPIKAITRAASSITADRLGERLPVPRADDEIGRHIGVLNSMFDRLQRSFEQANRFTADAAHELRTPLTIMRGQIEEALRSGSVTPAQERMLVGLLEENTSLQRISDNLLLLARFDTGKNPLVPAPVDLSALVAEAREDAELLAASESVRVVAEVAPGVVVQGDPVMLRRVVLNLIDNAVKFNRQDGELRIRLRAVEGGAELAIGNTGASIPVEKRGRLFERFYRVAEDRNRDTGGSGLGLSLCREIVAAHGGRIELARSDEAWTEFTVSLPAQS